MTVCIGPFVFWVGLFVVVFCFFWVERHGRPRLFAGLFWVGAGVDALFGLGATVFVVSFFCLPCLFCRGPFFWGCGGLCWWVVCELYSEREHL